MYCVDAIATLKADIVYLLILKTTVDDIEWSDSRRVDCVLCFNEHAMSCAFLKSKSWTPTS